MKLDIIIPAKNEEGNVLNIYNKVNEELKNIEHNFIFINDGSTDETITNLKKIYKKDKEHVKIINFSKNYGKEAAMYAGLKNSKGDFVAIIDCDLQQDPKYLVEMYNFLVENDEYDCICMCQKQHKKRFFQTVFYSIMKKLSGLDIKNGASDFRMFKRQMVNSILELSEKNRFSKGIFSYVGYNTYYSEYKVKERKSGKTKFNKKALFNYAVDGITAFSTKPLRFATFTGIITAAIAFIYLVYTIIKTIVTGIDIPGYASLLCVTLFFGGIQLIALGIIGEYLGRTYYEVKSRPIYIAKEMIGFEEDYL